MIERPLEASRDKLVEVERQRLICLYNNVILMVVDLRDHVCPAPAYHNFSEPI